MASPIRSESIAQSLYNSAKEYARLDNWEEAVPLFTQATALGFSKAQNRLGMCYAQGVGVETDVGQAVHLFLLAADQDNRAAQYNLAGCLKKGMGVVQSDKLATDFYQRAADNGLALAQCRIGDEHENREPIDLFRAAHFYQLAADQKCS